MPTLLGLCGLPVPKSVEGLDFTGLMRGGPDPSGGAAIIQCVSPFGEFTRAQGGREYRAVRTVRHTYVRDLAGSWLLFDNQTDPGQLDNLAGKPGHARLEAKLTALLQKKLAAQHDDFRPGSDYIARWGYQVDASGTASTAP